ncbi:MAG: PEP-CTERM sorting domain-containing protein [Pirellulales bacterium]|nr:PEP-CTERM sorting domain-containing protein [Pirellulales bacterium]
MKSLATNLRRTLFAAICLLTIPGVASAAFLGASATIDQLTPGMSIGVNGYTFTDFKLTPTASVNHTPIPPENFSVTAIALPNDKVELKFQFPGVWKEGEFSEFVLDFTALAPQGYAFMEHGLSFGPVLFGDLSGNPYATIVEKVVPMDPNSTQAPYTLGVFSDPGFTQLVDSKPIVTPANKLQISKDIQIYGGNGDGPTRVVLTDFSQTFMGVVPEPTTIGLAMIGLIAVTAVRRNRG